MDFERNITIEAHGGIGGPGGQSGSGGGGVGGIGQGPQFHVSGTSHWNVHSTSETVFSAALKTKQRKPCPLPVSSFTGRQETLQEIHQYFGQAQGTRLVFILHGLGGSGKSQLAFKFVQEAQVKQRFSDVFFIDATSEQTAETDLKLLAPANDNTPEAALSWLGSNHNEWLIVFDNADDIALDIAKFFPPCTFGSILITTRNPQLCIHGVDSRVSNMTLDDASNLLLKLAKRKAIQDNKKELAIAIVKELHCFALAVSQAGGYINARGDLESYLTIYKSSHAELLQRNDIQGQSQYSTAIYTTWDLSYNKLSSKGKLLLQIFSCLHHQGIGTEIFQRASLSGLQMDDRDFQVQVNQVLAQLGGGNQTWDALTFDNIVGELQAYSLIEQNLYDQSFSVHPLVQQWSNHTTEQNMSFIQTCVLAIIAMSSYFNTEDFKYIARLLHHMTRLSQFFQQPLDIQISVRLGYIAEKQGLWSDSEILHRKVLERRKKLLGGEHPDTLTSMNNLAWTYWSQGRWSDAEGLQVAVLEIRKRLLGEEHPDTLTSMNNLASTYASQGRRSDAEGLEVAVLESRKRLQGEEHPDTLTSMHNLALTYGSQGRWSDAEGLQVAVLEIRKRLLGEEHPDTLTSMHTLAGTYSSQGRWSDAEVLQTTVLESSKRLLREEHPNTLISMSNLALTYWSQGRWSHAEALQVAMLESQERLLGEEHPDTLTSMSNLAGIYSSQGRCSDAEGLEVVVLERQKRLLGEEHPNTLTSMHNLALTYGSQGRWSDAEGLQVAVLERQKRVLGEEHPDTLTGMHNLALTYGRQGRWSDAEGLQVAVLEIRKRLLREEHPDILTSMSNLAGIYSSQGRCSDAEGLEVAVLKSRRRLQGEEHPETLTSMSNLALTYWRQGRWSDAEGLQVAVLEIQERLLGEEHPDTLTSMNNLALTYWSQGRWSDAKGLQVAVLEIRKRLLGEEHPDTLISMNNLATTYWSQGQWSDAEGLQVAVLEIRKRLLREEHPDTLTSMSNLAGIYSSQGRWSDAEGLQTGVLESSKRLLGKEHPHTLKSMHNLADIFEHQARYSEAEALRKAAQDIEQHRNAAPRSTQTDKLVVSPAKLALSGTVSEDPTKLKKAKKMEKSIHILLWIYTGKEHRTCLAQLLAVWVMVAMESLGVPLFWYVRTRSVCQPTTRNCQIRTMALSITDVGSILNYLHTSTYLYTLSL
ncbi:hypothetical protein R3P38DRAFT_3345817 [Favolaschia claudopus]|uniref:Kinesin light chain n=1 Tax=Favolaschia claudopus TaxID=2862362 RepID=A0AAW0DCA8_9AGAR